MSSTSNDETAVGGVPAQRRLLFFASCVALVATAMSFAVRADIIGDVERQLGLTDTQAGWAIGAWALGFAGAILIGGPLCDILGMGRLIWGAFAAHMIGILLTIFAPNFTVLFLATLIYGMGNGTVEATINPLTATLYPKEKTGKLNILHAWWPGGIVIGGLICFGISKTGLSEFSVGAGTGHAWQVKVATLLAPVLLYGALFMGRRVPPTERVAAGVATRDMWLEVGRLGFLLMMLCMVCTAATELGPNTWVGELMKRTLPGMAAAGILILVWIHVIMGIGRYFAGALAHAISPVGIVLSCAVVSGIGLVLVSYATTTRGAFAAAAVFALGICFFWPTMLGITSERFPKTGALGLAVMGSTGAFSSFLISPTMGWIRDQTGSEELALRYVAILPAVLVILFGSMLIYHIRRGGYRPVELSAEGEEEEAGVPASEPEQ